MPTDIDKGVELNRLYFDQMLLEILINPDGTHSGMNSMKGTLLGPIKERRDLSLQEERRRSLQKNAATGNGERKADGRKTLKRQTNTLDKEGPTIARFLEKKLNMKRPTKPAPLLPTVATVTTAKEASGTEVVGGAAAGEGPVAEAGASVEAGAAAKTPKKVLSLKTSDSFTLSQGSPNTPHVFSPCPPTPPVCVEQVISIRGIATTSEPVAVANASGEQQQQRSALVPEMEVVPLSHEWCFSLQKSPPGNGEQVESSPSEQRSCGEVWESPSTPVHDHEPVLKHACALYSQSGGQSGKIQMEKGLPPGNHGHCS